MDSLRICLLVFSCFVLVATVVSSDCVKQEFSGCNRVGKQCVCSTETACDNPFSYRDVRRCRRALFGDTCRKNNCENNGQCVQTKHDVYLCKCEGTGYYGHRCETKCPKDLTIVPDEDRLDAKACVF
ncbi:contactin-associated protein-like 2 [Patiria miniata]|uniref:EGF-like domain-containing protein n=1 Tax=Patiria miniata TaxID=46514 RepID=A0A913ZXT9_PATMI|nr:contactin-associated protein-like 2 [Patiria miniata]